MQPRNRPAGEATQLAVSDSGGAGGTLGAFPVKGTHQIARHRPSGRETVGRREDGGRRPSRDAPGVDIDGRAPQERAKAARAGATPQAGHIGPV